MKTCPKCGKKLHLYNWKQECPSCNVNMVYYKSNERLLEETEKTEIEHAKSQPKIDRAKAAFYGSPLAIIRIVVSLLPIGGLFLPLCKLKGVDGIKSVNVIGVYNYFSKADLGAVLDNTLLAVSLVTLLLSAVMILVCLGFTVMSLSKHGKIRNLLLNSFMLLSAIASAVCFSLNSPNISEMLPDYTAAKVSVGIFVYIGLMLVILIYNLVLDKVGLKVKHTACYIGGLTSEEYFSLTQQGVSDIEIRKKMVEALTKIQDEILAKEAEAKAKKEAERAAWK